jgi:hypothetical protein
VLVAVAAIGVLVAVCVAAGPALVVDLKIINSSGGQVNSVEHEWVNWSREEFRVHMARGVADSQGSYVACHIVRPALKDTRFENTPFRVYDDAGNVVANSQTPCP